jgi:hypothetical protein
MIKKKGVVKYTKDELVFLRKENRRLVKENDSLRRRLKMGDYKEIEPVRKVQRKGTIRFTQEVD